MNFRKFINESLYYHGTSSVNAASILSNGIDPGRYQSGMFLGFYLTPNLTYFQHRKPEAVLQFEIDDSKIFDISDITDQMLASIDPHFQMMSYGYKNSLITRYAKQNGYSGIRNGKEVVLFDNSAIKSMSLV